MAQIYTSLESRIFRLGRREQLIMLEIGKDRIDTASSFVDYMNENYGFSKSSTWYCLNRLKDLGIAEFANRMEHRPLVLTRTGISELGKFETSRNSIIEEFSGKFLKGLERTNDYAFDSYGRVKLG